MGAPLVQGSIATQRSFLSPKVATSIAGFGIRQRKNNGDHVALLTSVRGGSSTVEEMADEDDEDEDIDEVESSEGEEDSDVKKVPSIVSKEPVRLILSTNWGNAVIDQTVELTPARTRDIGTIKKSLSKQLPGRPPIVALEIVYEGRVLDDDTLVDELFEDEEDEDEDEDEDEVEEGNEPSRKLTLNILPPVDPKFATELVPKLMSYSGDDDYETDTAATVGDSDSLTTDELVDAYYLNQVAMMRNAQLLADPNTPSSPFMRMELQDQARELREQLQSETPVEIWEKCMTEPTKGGSGSQVEWRGQRYRSSKGGVTTQLKTTIQTNLNVVRRWRFSCTRTEGIRTFQGAGCFRYTLFFLIFDVPSYSVPKQ